MIRVLILIISCFCSLLLSGVSLAQLPGNWGHTFVIKEYDQNRFNQVRRVSTGSYTNNFVEEFMHDGDASWKVIRSFKPVSSDSTAVDLSYTFYLQKGSSPGTSVGIIFQVNDWSVDNYVFSPAALYNGNRFQSRRIDYSPRLMHPKDVGLNVPAIISDVPRLDNNNGPSRIQLTSGAASFPCMGYYQFDTKRGFLVTINQGNSLGDYGMEIEESRDRRTAWFSITSPHVRELYKYKITDNTYPSNDVAHDFKAGDSVVITCRVYFFNASTLSKYFEQYFSLHHQLVRKLSFTRHLPFSAAFDLIEEKYNRMNWNHAGFYAMDAIDNNRHWKPGWVSGMPVAYALSLGNNTATRERLVMQNNWLFSNGIAPSGFFYERGLDGTQWIGGDMSKFHTHDWHLVRSSADGLYYALKLLMQMQNEFKDSRDFELWKSNIQNVANAFLNTWKKYKQFGHFINTQTGDIIVGGSASGAIAPGALVLAAQIYKQPAYMEVARQAGVYYYESFVARGITTGGPGDALQNPDSESCYALLESYMELYEATREKRWLQYAEETAWLFATWVMPYHYLFPASSLLGTLKSETGGTVWANTQNKHAAPGICTASGMALFKLYRATGNAAYLELLRPIAQAIPQYISTVNRPIGKLPPGCIDERVSTNDWLEGTGEIANLSTWAEVAMMLTAKELPGIYVQRNNRSAIVFDHMNAKITGKGSAIYLQVENPTDYKASVRIVVDENILPLRDAGEPLKELLLNIAPGQRIEVKL